MPYIDFALIGFALSLAKTSYSVLTSPMYSQRTSLKLWFILYHNYPEVAYLVAGDWARRVPIGQFIVRVRMSET